MTNPEGSFIWYELMTPDPDAATSFYDAVVGWRIDGRPAGGGMDYRMINTGEGAAGGAVGGVFRLEPDMIAGGARPAWLGYLSVADVDAKAQAIKDAGGAIMVPPTDIPDVGRFAMVTDPGGAPFYIMRTNSSETSNSFSPATPGHVAWNELMTPDQDAALRFYGGMFGVATEGAMDMGDMGPYTFLTHAGRRIGAMMTAPGGIPPSWNFYWQVTDIDRAIATIRERGGTVVNGPHVVPTGDQVVTATDPQGAVFSLVGPGNGGAA